MSTNQILNNPINYLLKKNLTNANDPHKTLTKQHALNRTHIAFPHIRIHKYSTGALCIRVGEMCYRPLHPDNGAFIAARYTVVVVEAFPMETFVARWIVLFG